MIREEYASAGDVEGKISQDLDKYYRIQFGGKHFLQVTQVVLLKPVSFNKLVETLHEMAIVLNQLTERTAAQAQAAEGVQGYGKNS